MFMFIQGREVLGNGGGVEWQILKFIVPRSPEWHFQILLYLFCWTYTIYWFKTCNWFKLQKSLHFPLIFLFFLAISL
jgi:hypothetical protein